MRINILLIALSLILCSMHPVAPATNSKPGAYGPTDYATASLKYSGAVVGYAKFNVAINIEIDTSIGIRYEVAFSGDLTSHMAIFYKFNKPYQTIHYNFLTHKSSVLTGGGGSKDPDVAVMGTENINNYSCTHLQRAGDHETQDYWMSKSVPGFAQVVKALKKIDPNLEMMAIDQSIFHWGGIVRLKMKSVTSKGETTTFNLDLNSAQAGIPINLADFEVPTK